MTSPDDDARQRWIDEAAADLRAALADPAIRGEVAALTVGDPADVRRRRRLADVREEVAGFELTWQRRDEGESSGRDD